MKSGLAVGLGLAFAAACSEDGRVLWENGGGAGGEENSTGTAGAGQGGMPVMPPNEAGGPPEPTPLECVTRGMDPCQCVAGVPCYCSAMMEPGTTCAMACVDGGCDMHCSAASCNADCDESCVIQCDPFTSCTIGCGQDCNVVCHEGASCALWSWSGLSHIYCAAGAVCECMIPGSCTCSGAGCTF